MFAVYQYSAWNKAYRLLDVLQAKDERQAAAAVKLKNCIVGVLYVKEVYERRQPFDVPSQGDFARSLNPV